MSGAVPLRRDSVQVTRVGGEVCTRFSGGKKTERISRFKIFRRWRVGISQKHANFRIVQTGQK